MTVAIDGTEYIVKICENDEDYATPKAVREAVAAQLAKQTVIDKRRVDLIKEAKALGLIIADPSQIPPHAEDKPKAPVPQVRPKKQEELPTTAVPSSQVLKPDITVQPTAMGSDGSSWSGEAYGSYALDKTFERKDGTKQNIRDMVVESQTVPGRSGQPILIPARIKGDSGESEINFVKIDDRELQGRFKRLNEKPIAGAYGSVRDCNMCRSTGRIKNKTCPRCEGRGYRDN